MTATATASNTSNKNGKDLPGLDAAGDFLEIDLDRPSFKADLFLDKKPGSLVQTYVGKPCQGYVVGHTAMPAAIDDDGVVREWSCYVIELTAPTTAVDRGEPREMKIGETVLVAESALLKQSIPEQVANHPTHMAHVRIRPISKAPMKDDPKKSMWLTKVDIGQNPVARKSVRSGNAVIASMLASAKTAQLAG